MSPPTETPPAGSPPRTVFFVSDGTGVTVETLGHSLLSQFESLPFRYVIIPFVNSREKAEAAVARIEAQGRASGSTPIVFSSLVDEDVRATVAGAPAFTLDFFSAFLGPLEEALGTRSSHALGRAHGMRDSAGYLRRIDAVNFALATDDGLNVSRYEEAQVILIGLSRVGKTPTSLYLALQYGIFAANYPLAEDDLESDALPPLLAPWRERLFGLTIDPGRLTRIRRERRPGSAYSEPARVRREVEHARNLMRANDVPMLDSTAVSVEEIAATILYQKGLTPSLP